MMRKMILTAENFHSFYIYNIADKFLQAQWKLKTENAELCNGVVTPAVCHKISRL